MYEKDGTRYEGSWVNGLRCGKGISALPDGTIFKGSYEPNKWGCKGVRISEDNKRFEGFI